MLTHNFDNIMPLKNKTNYDLFIGLGVPNYTVVSRLWGVSTYDFPTYTYD